MGASLIGGGLGLLGSVIGGNSAQKAAQTSANAQTEAARMAAEAQKFRPVGITSRFGTSQFTTDPTTGYLTGAGYDVSPDVAALRDQFLSQAGGQGAALGAQGLQGAQSLFNLGQQYLAESPQQAAQNYMAQQQALLQPGREQAQAGLTQNLFNTGRGGVAVSQGGMMGAANPELQALLNAQSMQDLQLAAQAQQAGQAQTQFGAGLFGLGSQAATAGYGPVQTQLGLASTLEQLGQAPLEMGSALGGRSAAAGANVGQTLLSGGVNAARALQPANAYNPYATALTGLAGNQQFTQGLSNWMNPYGGTPQGAYGQQDQYLAGAMASPQTQQARMLASQWGE
jgi:hypothetical protein